MIHLVFYVWYDTYVRYDVFGMIGTWALESGDGDETNLNGWFSVHEKFGIVHLGRSSRRPEL
jgi:hypothetical protein